MDNTANSPHAEDSNYNLQRLSAPKPKLKDEDNFARLFLSSSKSTPFKSGTNFHLITRLIRFEFEKLGISQKYIGFKYLVDTASLALSNHINKIYCTNIFQQIADLNNTSYESVERDIRHMLSTLWQNNKTFKTIISYNLAGEQINSKCILTSLIEHLNKVI